MPILVVCRNCQQRFQVSDKFAGKQGPCPKCKATIYIPKPEEEVKIHTPEHSEASARGVTGKLALKPISRTATRLAVWQIGALVGGGVALLIAALAMRWFPALLTPVALVGLVAISPPLVAAAYTFLRDQELEPYTGLWFWIRCGICAAVYIACWGAFAWLPEYAKDELWKWVFMGPAFAVVGSVAALAALDMDFGNAFFHFCFYVCATILLALAMGLPVFG